MKKAVLVSALVAVLSAAAATQDSTVITNPPEHFSTRVVIPQLVSLLGIYLSLHLDLPTGATIVVTFGGVLLIMAAARPFLRRSRVVSGIGTCTRVS